ncbi:hypothetical protein [Larsenimonas rhizosphaerae]|uniref:Uncharacterized protein n=1 Tax=Larsenimonas rhizosphaerae TaxID=2944682 RepID=A0AA42CT65_9GAMM|nr:hypothetical protein [Larsenimonas rhizosphaerae]MCM2130157.1 hypothetical protein [Larsenimonas rhizosphaerae]MCX2522844.1 hypothetical protein [Larsenimonas rhizosphaerae]
MAGFRGRGPRQPKPEARGTLEHLEREGPFKEWLGMPDLYRYTLTVNGETYSHQVEDTELAVKEGDYVVFRYKETKAGRWIERRSLGVAIDPATFNRE